VAQRANQWCEYCLIHEEDAAFAHEVDHVISRQQGGKTHTGQPRLRLHALQSLQRKQSDFDQSVWRTRPVV